MCHAKGIVLWGGIVRSWAEDVASLGEMRASLKRNKGRSLTVPGSTSRKRSTLAWTPNERNKRRHNHPHPSQQSGGGLIRIKAVIRMMLKKKERFHHPGLCPSNQGSLPICPTPDDEGPGVDGTDVSRGSFGRHHGRRRVESGGDNPGPIYGEWSCWSDITLVAEGPVEVVLDIETKAKGGLLRKLGKLAPYNLFEDRQQANP